MNIKVNSINFTGKKEVLYALTKAAQKAKDIEYYNQPSVAPCNIKSKIELQAIKEASMKAYLDMAFRDEAFEKTVREMKIPDLYYMHVLLMPEQTKSYNIIPMNRFKQAAQSVIDTIGLSKISIQRTLEDLYKKLEL